MSEALMHADGDRAAIQRRGLTREQLKGEGMSETEIEGVLRAIFVSSAGLRDELYGLAPSRNALEKLWSCFLAIAERGGWEEGGHSQSFKELSQAISRWQDEAEVLRKERDTLQKELERARAEGGTEASTLRAQLEEEKKRSERLEQALEEEDDSHAATKSKYRLEVERRTAAEEEASSLANELQTAQNAVQGAATDPPTEAERIVPQSTQVQLDELRAERDSLHDRLLQTEEAVREAEERARLAQSERARAERSAAKWAKEKEEEGRARGEADLRRDEAERSLAEMRRQRVELELSQPTAVEETTRDPEESGEGGSRTLWQRQAELERELRHAAERLERKRDKKRRWKREATRLTSEKESLSRALEAARKHAKAERRRHAETKAEGTFLLEQELRAEERCRSLGVLSSTLALSLFHRRDHSSLQAPEHRC